MSDKGNRIGAVKIYAQIPKWRFSPGANNS